MVAAIIGTDGRAGYQKHLHRDEDIPEQFMQARDLDCLINMGCSGCAGAQITDGAQPEAPNELVSKYRSCTLTADDLRQPYVHISVGAIKCESIAEGEQAIEQLLQAHPDAR